MSVESGSAPFGAGLDAPSEVAGGMTASRKRGISLGCVGFYDLGFVDSVSIVS